MNVKKAALANNIKIVISISTDKAVDPYKHDGVLQKQSGKGN